MSDELNLNTLATVPVDELMKELARRNQTVVVAVCKRTPEGNGDDWAFWFDGPYTSCRGLVELLREFIITEPEACGYKMDDRDPDDEGRPQ